MFWKTTIIALVAMVAFGGTADARGHCTTTPELLIANLTSAEQYGEVLLATGKSEVGNFSFYGEPFEGAGGAKSPDTRTFSLLRDGWDTNENIDASIQCMMVWGMNLRIVPDSLKQTYSEGLVNVMFAQRNDSTALMILRNPDTGAWKIMQVNNMGTDHMQVVVAAFGTDFVLIAEQDPEPESDATPEPGSDIPWNG